MGATATKDYPVMFTPPGTDEEGVPEGVECLEAILALEPNDDGYIYAAFGPKTQESLRSLADSLRDEGKAISEDQLEQLGSLVDCCENYAGAAKLPMPAEFHVEQLTKGFERMAEKIKALYIEIAGEDPWEI